MQGTWPAKLKVIDTPLHKYLLPDGERRVRVTTAEDPDGMRSITLVKVRASAAARPDQGLPALSLLEVTIKTGRTHQIRVHLAAQGHPIAGDDKYGDFDLNKRLQKAGLKRMFLHAWRLQFTHPASGAPVAIAGRVAARIASLCACTRLKSLQIERAAITHRIAPHAHPARRWLHVGQGLGNEQARVLQRGWAKVGHFIQQVVV